MTRSQVSKFGPKLAAVSSLVAVGAANAAADLAPITAAQTDLLAYAAALLAMAIAVWAAVKLVRFFGPK